MNKMGRLPLALIATFGVLTSATAIAAEMTCSIGTKHHCEAAAGCQQIDNTISVRIDFDRKNYSRCDANGCDRYDVQIWQSGPYYNIGLPGALAKVSSDDRSFVEVLTSALQTFISFGKCDVGP
jgi:hypothetical protein